MEHSSMPQLRVLQVLINVWFSTNSKQSNVIPLASRRQSQHRAAFLLLKLFE
jgi:hypothetical protein